MSMRLKPGCEGFIPIKISLTFSSERLFRFHGRDSP